MKKLGLDKAKPQENLIGLPRILTQYKTNFTIKIRFVLFAVGIPKTEHANYGLRLSSF